MGCHRWLAIDAACAAGASQAQIDTALHYPAGHGQGESQANLNKRKSLGLVSPERHDPGNPKDPSSDRYGHLGAPRAR